MWDFHIAISPSPTRDDREKGKIKSGHLLSHKVLDMEIHQYLPFEILQNSETFRIRGGGKYICTNIIILQPYVH